MKRLTTLRASIAVCISLAVAGCSSGEYSDTPIPSKTTTKAAPAPAATKAPDCGNPVQSYQPSGSLPAPTALPAGSTMAKIRARGRLIAGVSADSLQLGARNPITGSIEGFDIDMLHAVSQAIFGDPNKIEFRVISTADRFTVLQSHSVDIVARAVTMNCDRWDKVAFSTEYYHAGQKLLVPLGNKATGLDDLAQTLPAGQRQVCAQTGSTAIDTVKQHRDLTLVPAGTGTGCLVLFQQGKANAIVADDTVLAGLAAQDPYAKVLRMKAISNEPYGLAMPKDQTDLVRFVNQVLDTMRADGRLTASYNRWFKELGPAPAPPKAVYGR
ncbi:glutamate ABC transporter substrate-binding protein [Luteipulveratus mongoliensis]|uniref:Solute-binding protein family 3/N-terminal domain-containing protein n=1 Tax=Luteipulveratus mongoliensis TaxID=571913 RepID=A0A0K1JM92_9MICO|nr:glutamate ABC transporter substrate-binding protein [Luteipulveratus mongoliensis]AKU17837.1 hypothetical protein VV02_21535 [Luteipulveratus mongoliensis]